MVPQLFTRNETASDFMKTSMYETETLPGGEPLVSIATRRALDEALLAARCGVLFDVLI